MLLIDASGQFHDIIALLLKGASGGSGLKLCGLKCKSGHDERSH
jgi:hypothetical protein